MSFRVAIGYAQRQGNRPSQQDRVLHEKIGDSDPAHVAVVTDGMGGRRGGGESSEIAATTIIRHLKAIGETLVSRYGGRSDIGDEEIQAAVSTKLKTAFDRAFYAILNASQTQDFQDMGTMALAAVVFGPYLFLGHVGDCRAYRVAQGQAEQITTDHSILEACRKAKETGRAYHGVEPSRAETMLSDPDAFYNLLRQPAQYLGVNSLLLNHGERPCAPLVDFGLYRLERGAIYVLATDGLNPLSLDQIASAATTITDPTQAADNLCDLALASSGNKADNTTVLVVKGLP